MIPGEMFIKDGEITLNAGRKTVTLTVANSGDRPIQVGSHYHFFETNPALKFERKRARGMRLHAITRHMVGAFHGVPGARAFRRALAENCVKPDAGIEQLRDALKLIVPAETAGAAA